MRFERPSLVNSKEIFGRLKFRTKFEVAIAEWNPKIDIITLGSSEGEVLVKRYLWKTGWRRNLLREKQLKQFEMLIDGLSDCPYTDSKDQQQDKDELLTLCWSPNGQVLLAAFSSGKCYYLDTQTGNTLFIRKLGYTPMRINWLKYRTKDRIEFPAQGEQPFTMNASDFNFREDAPKEHADACSSVEQFYRKSLHQSLVGTFLCVMHLDGQSTIVDIFVDGILPIQRFSIEQALTECLQHPVHPYQISVKNFSFKNQKFFIPFTIDDENFPQQLQQQIADFGADAILEFSHSVTPSRMRIYSQIADCLGWISFCCLYLQEMYAYCAQNWQQTSQAFHQRVFAAVSNQRSSRTAVSASSSSELLRQNSSTPPSHLPSAREGSLQMCRDLLVVMDDGEASELLEKFLGSPTAEKELKQASSFVDRFTVLIKGISNGLLPAARLLRHAICALRTHLINLDINLENENDDLDAKAVLLDTLLGIADGQPAFNSDPTEGFGQNNEELDDFERDLLLLEQILQKVLKLAAQNRNELNQLLHWLIALIYESGNECTSVIDESEFDVKLLNRFISEVIDRSGLNEVTDGKCILDRVYGCLVASQEGTNETSPGQEQQQAMDCSPTTSDPVEPSSKENKEGDEKNEGGDENADDSALEKENAQFDSQFPGVRTEYPRLLMGNGRKVGRRRQPDGNHRTTGTTTTIWQRIQQCLRHFQTFYRDGIIKFVHSSVNPEKCSILPANSAQASEYLLDQQESAAAASDNSSSGHGSDMELEMMSDEEMAEEMAGDGQPGNGHGGIGAAEEMFVEARGEPAEKQQPPLPRPPQRRGGGGGGEAVGAEQQRQQQQLSLHAFIFGYGSKRPVENATASLASGGMAK